MDAQHEADFAAVLSQIGDESVRKRLSELSDKDKLDLLKTKPSDVIFRMSMAIIEKVMSREPNEAEEEDLTHLFYKSCHLIFVAGGLKLIEGMRDRLIVHKIAKDVEDDKAPKALATVLEELWAAEAALLHMSDKERKTVKDMYEKLNLFADEEKAGG